MKRIKVLIWLLTGLSAVFSGLPAASYGGGGNRDSAMANICAINEAAGVSGSFGRPSRKPAMPLWKSLWYNQQHTPHSTDTCKRVDTAHGGPRDTSTAASDGRIPVNVETGHDLTNTLIVDFFTGFSGVHYQNAQQDDQHNHLYFYYSFSLNNNAKFRKFSIRMLANNEYGVRMYEDSITAKAEDRYQYRAALTVPVLKNRIRLQSSFAVRSQLWKTRAYDEDGLQFLYSDYFSPGYTMFNAGLNFNFLQGATADIGLVGGKVTKIRNSEIFSERGVTKLYGLSQGERRKLEYGLSVHMAIPPQKVGEHLYWELNGSLFVPKDSLGKPQAYTYDANNAFHLVFLRHIRLTLRSQLLYDPGVSWKVFMMNHITLGFYLSNKL